MEKWVIRDILERAFREDMPMGDITTDNTVPCDSISKAFLIAKQDGVIAGLEICIEAFRMLDPDVNLEPLVKDGDFVRKGDRILVVEGNSRALLKAERTALNILQRLSGIATETRKYVEKLRVIRRRLWIHGRPHRGSGCLKNMPLGSEEEPITVFRFPTAC